MSTLGIVIHSAVDWEQDAVELLADTGFFVVRDAIPPDDITIGEQALIGRGAVITRDKEPMSVNVAESARKVARSSSYLL